QLPAPLWLGHANCHNYYYLFNLSAELSGSGGRVITMSRTIQVTFDCADPQTLSRFWAAVLGYDIPAPPGYAAATGQDVFAAWHAFLGRVGVPESEWNSRSAVEDPA